MVLNRSMALAIVGISAIAVALGVLYSLQLGTLGEVSERTVTKLTWERTGGFLGLEEELVIERDGSARYTSDDFGDGDLVITEDELANLMAMTRSLRDTAFVADPGAADYFTYRIAVQTSSGSSTIEWVDDWASLENLPSDLEELQGQIESIIARIWLQEGVSGKADERAIRIAREFLVQAPTFKFDGILDTIEIGEVETATSIPPIYTIHITFDSRQPGYGDREGQALIQVITSHEAKVVVIREHVVSAIIDDQWNELNQKPLM